MENVILIVCPQGFAPLTSKRHTYAGCDDMFLFVLFFCFFILFFFLPPHFHKSVFFGWVCVCGGGLGGVQLFVESLFDEVITRVD